MPITTTPTKVDPIIAPDVAPERRYDPEPDHCPGQWKRTTRRVREI